ncbi:hypothetical protein, partial [Salmonella sp. s54836]|uniref:hypothetical protein n=1 Tax=Salmonella sp. s54836 TaxID=3159673 RepID=UPI00398183AA
MTHVNHEQSIYLKKNSSDKTPFDIALDLKQEDVLSIYRPYARPYYFGEDTSKRYLNTCINNRMDKTLANIIKFVPADFFQIHPMFLHQMFKKKVFHHFPQIFDKFSTDNEDKVVFITRFLDSNEQGQYPDNP